jgi:hypothetical protein
MTVRVSVDSNVGSVIRSIDDVKDDLRHEIRKRVGAAMRVLWADAKQYVLDDPHYGGDLFRALQNESDTSGTELSFRVYTDARVAAHAAIVEYGSGARSNVAYDTAEQVPPGTEDSVPPGYPFESPDIDFNERNPINTEGYPSFYGFTKYIEEWMRTKPVKPMTGDYFASAALIAATIVEKGNYAHPFLRPAWFDNELKIKRAARHAVRNAVR